jgi:serine/threonine protein kinase/Leucine-rich repeat (LRR) protein
MAMNERILFEAARELTDASARDAYLSKACEGDSTLRARVEALLKSDATAGSFLDVPPVGEFDGDRYSGPANTILGNSEHDDEGDFEASAPDLSFLQPSSKPGSIGVLAHYEVLSVLGQGAFGIVFKAFDEKLHRLVAIKVMNPQLAITSPPRKRFLREARAAAAIRHENVVQVYSVEEQPLPYLVMEFIDGQTLKEKLDGAGPLEASEVLNIARQIANGLAAAQAMGLIHRDIKPANILLERGAEQRVKISDFGLARAADDASMTRTGVISGTPMYMAPEQATGQSLDHRADLFSLGSVLYQMCCGRPPFRAPTTVAVLRRVVEDTPRRLQEILPEIPDWLVAIVTKLLAKNPDDRFQTAKEVADLLARCQSELQLNGKVTCVAATESLRDLESEARSESSKGVKPQSASAFAKPQSVPRKVTAKPIVLSLLLGMLIMTPILFGRHLSSAFNKWFWPAIPTLPATEVATGLRFDGKDDYVKVGPINLSSPQYTLEAFVTSAKDGDNGVIALLKNVGKESELLYLYDGYPGKERQSGAGIVGQRPYQSVNAPLPSGTRQHRALVFDGSAMHYYVNGIWQGKRNCTALRGLMWEMRELYIGCKGNETQFFRGQIDQLRLSKIARYNNNFTVASTLTSDDSTLALYNFDEGQGDILNDSSGHGHQGKIVGATWARPNASSSSRAPVESTDSTNPDRQAAEYVLGVGGTVTIDDGQEHSVSAKEKLPIGSWTLRSINLYGKQVDQAGLRELSGLTDLVSLDLGDTKVTDATLKELSGLTSLSWLAIPGTLLTDAGLKELAGLTNIEQVALQNTKLTDAGLVHLKAWTKLSSLGINDTQISDAGLTHFKDFKNLTALHLHNTSMSDLGLEYLADCPKLVSLKITNTKVTEAGVKKLSAALPECRIEWDGGVIETAVSPDRRAAEYVLSMGGTVKITEKGMERPATAIGELPRGAFELTSVILGQNEKVSESGLAAFKDCKNLTTLHLFVISVTPAGMSHFRNCTKITNLSLYGTQSSDAALAHFRDCKQLTLLDLTYTQVSDLGLSYFKDCKDLRSLNLRGTLVTDAGMAHFKDCRNLESLVLDGTKVTDAGMAHFKDRKNLSQLSLVDTNVTDAGLVNFKNCTNLTGLDLRNTPVSDAGLVHLQDCKGIASLYLGNTAMGDAGLAFFKDCKNLIYLQLTSTQVSDAGLVHLQNFKNLHHLSLGHTRVSDAGLPDLALLSSVQGLVLTGARVSRQGFEQIRAALPHGSRTDHPDLGVFWSEPNRSAAESLLALGGSIEIGKPGVAETYAVKTATDLPADYFQVRRVSLAGVATPLDKLAELWPLLSALSFAEFDQLESLDLSGITGLNYDFLVPIHGLQELSLANAGLNDVSLVQLPKLPALKRLVLDGNEIRSEGLAHLSSRSELIDLSLGCPSIVDLIARNLADLKHVKRLSLAGSGLTDAGIKHLAGLTNLESLDLRRTKVTTTGIDGLKAALPGCRIEWDGDVIERTD